MLLFRRSVHRQGGNHNRVASRGNDRPVGDQTAKYAFTVGDELLAKLKCVIHARLPSLWSLRARDHRSAQNSSNDKLIVRFTGKSSQLYSNSDLGCRGQFQMLTSSILLIAAVGSRCENDRVTSLQPVVRISPMAESHTTGVLPCAIPRAAGMEPVRHRISLAGRFLVTSLPGFAPTASHHERRIMSRQGADTSIADVSRIQQNVRFESESGQIASQGRCHATLLDESIATAGAPDNQGAHRV